MFLLAIFLARRITRFAARLLTILVILLTLFAERMKIFLPRRQQTRTIEPAALPSALHCFLYASLPFEHLLMIFPAIFEILQTHFALLTIFFALRSTRFARLVIFLARLIATRFARLAWRLTFLAARLARLACFFAARFARLTTLLDERLFTTLTGFVRLTAFLIALLAATRFALRIERRAARARLAALFTHFLVHLRLNLLVFLPRQADLQDLRLKLAANLLAPRFASAGAATKARATNTSTNTR